MLNRNRVLIISGYPIVSPMHGGQKRTKAFYEYYKSKFQQVKYIGVFHRNYFSEYSEEDLLLAQPDIIKELEDSPYLGDIIVGEAISRDIHIRSALAKILMEYKPDIIHVEQVYGFMGLSVLLDELRMKPYMIFGSQNIEYLMKQKIYKDISLTSSVAKSAVKKIKTYEERFSKEADLVVAVSNSDASHHEKMGAKNVVVIPNGMDKLDMSSADVAYWKKLKKWNKVKNLISFIGSGHPPNWVGFIDMLGEDLSFMPEDSKIVLAGGVSDYFTTIYKPESKYPKLWNYAIPAGRISEDRLRGLIDQSEVLLLPITSGGGSNLKTAEAILSGKKTVATEYALRGYDGYNDFPNMYVAPSNKEAYRQMLIDVIKLKTDNLSEYDIQRANKLTWTESMKPLDNKLKIGLAYYSVRKASVWVKRKMFGLSRRLKSIINKLF